MNDAFPMVKDLMNLLAPAAPEQPAPSDSDDLRSQFSILFRSLADRNLAAGSSPEELRLLLQEGRTGASTDEESPRAAARPGLAAQVLASLLAALEARTGASLPAARENGGAFPFPEPGRPTAEPASIQHLFSVSGGTERTTFSAPDGSGESPRLHPAVSRVCGGILSLVGGRGRMVIRLHPPRLGTVWVKVSSSAGGTRVELRTERQEAHNLLLRSAGEIRRRLEGAGVNVDRFDVTSFENQGREGRGREGGRKKKDGEVFVLPPSVET